MLINMRNEKKRERTMAAIEMDFALQKDKLKVLETYLSNGDVEARRGAVIMLHRLCGENILKEPEKTSELELPKIIELISRCLEDEDEEVRALAALVSTEVTTKVKKTEGGEGLILPLIAPLIEALKKDSAREPSLLTTLVTPFDSIRSYYRLLSISRALHAIGNPAISEVEKLLNHEDKHIRWKAKSILYDK
jgi:HEAT repeat protein